jgi:hypothetical protein
LSAEPHQDIIPAPLPAVRASSMHFLSAGTAILAYWLPLPIPSAIASKTSFRFRTTRDHVVLLASIFAFQAFAFRPQPTQLDALVIGPLAMITFALYEPPLPALKQDGQGVSLPEDCTCCMLSNSGHILPRCPPAEAGRLSSSFLQPGGPTSKLSSIPPLLRRSFTFSCSTWHIWVSRWLMEFSPTRLA